MNPPGPCISGLPVLQIREKTHSTAASSVHWGGHEKENQSRIYQAFRGQLKLSVYYNYGLLTAHIMQARHLYTRSKKPCDAYVKLCLAPDPAKRTKCQTDIVHEVNHPVFDEKFSFELIDEDFHKRLFISVWHKDMKRGQNELLGCMSFGIQHINMNKKPIHGWYFLLSEELGRRKHLHVGTRKFPPVEMPQPTPPTLTTEPPFIPSVNSDLQFMSPHVIVIRRGSTGFGFSLMGASPVKISRVETDSPAMLSGLQREDCIVRVNNINVSRSSADSIATIIKHSKIVTLEVQRPQLYDLVDQLNQKPYSSTIKSSSGYHSDSDVSECGSQKKPLRFCGTFHRKHFFKDVL